MDSKKKKNACGIKSVRFASKLCNMYTLNWKKLDFLAGQDEAEKNCILITRHDLQEKNKTMQFLIHLPLEIIILKLKISATKKQ